MFDKELLWERMEARPTWVKVLIGLAPVALAAACWANFQALDNGSPERPPVSSACAYLSPQDVTGIFKVTDATLVEETPRDVAGIPVYGCQIRTASTLRLRLDVENHGGKPQTAVIAMAVSKQSAYTTAGEDAELSVVKQVDKKFYVLKLKGSRDGTPATEAELATLASLVTGRF